MGSVTAARPMRADALRNRERVIAAAESLFAERGLDASIEDVAARAGVGRATIYRSYPSKEHLIAGIAIERLGSFEQLATDALEDADAGAALRRVLVTIAEAQASDRIMLAALSSASHAGGLDEARAATRAALERLMRRARRQGSLRRDASPEDVRVLMTGLTYSLTAEQQHDVKVWRRYANLVVDALAA